jgi:hypothetical protein
MRFMHTWRTSDRKLAICVWTPEPVRVYTAPIARQLISHLHRLAIVQQLCGCIVLKVFHQRHIELIVERVQGFHGIPEDVLLLFFRQLVRRRVEKAIVERFLAVHGLKHLPAAVATIFFRLFKLQDRSWGGA